MRTKITILSAVALAAGLLTSNAQVYSANVVGYYNVTVPAGKFVFAANQLQGTGGNNSISGQFSNGVYSDPNGVTNTVLYYWDNNIKQFKAFQYWTAADFGAGNSGNGYYDLAFNFVGTSNVLQGGGCFIYNAAAAPLTYTIVGQVLQGTNVVPVTTGFNVYSITPPISTNLTAVNFPGSSPGDGNGNTYDSFYRYQPNGGYQTFIYQVAAEGNPQGAGWYDLAYVFQNTNGPAWPKVGEAFFILHTAPSGATTWTSSFTVQ